MKHVLLSAALVAVMLPLSASVVAAGPIERACLGSDRRAANRQVCGCIQQVADMTLRGADQRKAARFFADPEEAQKVRMSKSDRDNEFWERYKAFGAAAESQCAG
jgi:hypothetical protein